MPSTQPKARIVILGAGFGGLYTARHLARLMGDSIDIALISRNNYFLMTPLLFEAGSGVLEPRHAVNPLRELLSRVRFIKGEVTAIDLPARRVTVHPQHDQPIHVEYDHLVLALGGVTNRSIIPGAEHSRTFKVLGDAISLRNHVIAQFEQADVETDANRKKSRLAFIVVGGGLVALELVGELNVFLKNLARLYKYIDPSQIRLEMIEAGPRIVPEFDPDLADYAQRTLEGRGVRIRVNTKVERVDADHVFLPGGESIEARTIVIATGVAPSPLVASLPIEKDKKGRALVEPTMRTKGHDNLWALGDCASIPDPSGHPYPQLAQHALRKARVLARNITAVLNGGDPEPFVYHSKGTLAALGHFSGIGRVYRFKIHGFVAWWVWRSYYLFQMPKWNRRLRIILDWTIALFFRNDIVEIDLGQEDQVQPSDDGNGQQARPPKLSRRAHAALRKQIVWKFDRLW